jgi:hypothetical protein
MVHLTLPRAIKVILATFIMSVGALFADVDALAGIQRGVVKEVNDDWVDVIFDEVCQSPVVVCTPFLPDQQYPAVATIIRRVTDYGFQVKLVRANAEKSILQGIDVAYLAFDQEANKSKVFFESGNSELSEICNKWEWNRSKDISLSKNFQNPIVFGQIVVDDDNEDFGYALFFSHGRYRSESSDGMILNRSLLTKLYYCPKSLFFIFQNYIFQWFIF